MWIKKDLFKPCLEQISFAFTKRKNLGATGDLFASASRLARADELPVPPHFALMERRLPSVTSGARSWYNRASSCEMKELA